MRNGRRRERAPTAACVAAHWSRSSRSRWVCWASSSAHASSSEPSGSAAPLKVVLKIGWTVEPDNLNPFVGWQNQDYEIWSINYELPVRLRHLRQADARPGERVPDQAERRPLGRRQGLDHPPQAGPEVERRPAAHRRRRRLHLQLHHQEQDVLNLAPATPRHHRAPRRSTRPTVQILCSRPKADMMRVLHPHRPRARLEQGRAEAGDHELHEPGADRRQRAVPA